MMAIVLTALGDVAVGFVVVIVVARVPSLSLPVAVTKSSLLFER